MNTEIALNNIVNYFCDILELPERDLPSRLEGHWDDVLRLANDQNVYFYLAAWMLEHWDGYLTDSMKERFVSDLEWNKARNVVLEDEIVELAQVFRQAGVKVLFIKGAAGIVRKLYPQKLRFLSDIDIFVAEKDVHKAHNCLLEHGYHTKEVNFQNVKRHHFVPYYNQNKLCGLELHIDPYHQNYLSRGQLVQFWDKAECTEFHGENIHFPSIADHAWILIRTELLSRICLPRLKDAIELSLILEKYDGSWLEEVINKATEQNVPNAVYGMLNSAHKYVNPCNSTVISECNGKYSQWEEWSVAYRKKHLLVENLSYNSEKDLAALRFYPANNIISKVKFIFWLLGYHYLIYLINVLTKIHLYKSLRIIKRLIFNKK